MKRLFFLVGVLFGFLLVPLVQAEVKFAVETPAPDAPVGGVDDFHGWVFSTEQGVSVTGVEIWIDDLMMQAPCCSLRSDVRKAFPDFPAANTEMSGWSNTLNWGNLSSGSHAVKVKFKTSDGKTAESNPFTVHVVRYGDFAFLDEFHPGKTCLIEGNQIVLPSAKLRDKESGQRRSAMLRFEWFLASQNLQLVGSSGGGGKREPDFEFQDASQESVIRGLFDESYGIVSTKVGQTPENLLVRVVNNATDPAVMSRFDPELHRPIIVINVGNTEWKSMDAVDRQYRIIVETVTALAQEAIGDPGIYRGPENETPFGGPVWVHVSWGTRIADEWLGAQGLGFTFEDIRKDRFNIVATVPDLHLFQLETWPQVTAAGEKSFSLMMLAADFLLTDKGKSYRDYLLFYRETGAREPGGWLQAFQLAFGQDVSSFVNDFESEGRFPR